jgi:prophage antirepressor-like protein
MPPSRLSCPGELTCHRPAEACAACRITHPGTAAGPAQLGLGGFPLEARELDPAGYRLALEEWATLPRGESAPHPCFFWAPLEYSRSSAHLAEVFGRAAEHGRAETRRQLGLPNPEALAAVPRTEALVPAAPLVRDFCGHRITTVEWHGRQIFFVDEIAAALEYANQNSLATRLREWTDEAEEGSEYLVLTNGDIRAVKALRQASDSTSGVESLDSPGEGGARKLLVLTEEGVNLVCIKTEKPAGKALRRWLAREVLPQIRRTGAYAPAAPGRAPGGSRIDPGGEGGVLQPRRDLAELCRHVRTPELARWLGFHAGRRKVADQVMPLIAAELREAFQWGIGCSDSLALHVPRPISEAEGKRFIRALDAIGEGDGREPVLPPVRSGPPAYRRDPGPQPSAAVPRSPEETAFRDRRYQAGLVQRTANRLHGMGKLTDDEYRARLDLAAEIATGVKMPGAEAPAGEK